MDETIKKRLKIIADLKDELRELQETHKSMLEDNEEYQEAQEKQEKLKEEKKASAEKAMKDPALVNIQEQMKDLKRDIKEHNEALSVDLVELYRKEGVAEVVDDDGNVKRMKFNVKLVG